ncbi:hypothetical protein, partial [Salmonella enterica]|uniref:hypothetical protein n=1 Tax=Salmonella enterica TaxID=28901 RepID=UPI001C395910
TPPPCFTTIRRRPSASIIASAAGCAVFTLQALLELNTGGDFANNIGGTGSVGSARARKD